MRNLYSRLAIFLSVSFILLGNAAQSQNFHLVKDINPLYNSDPGNLGFLTSQYAVTQSAAYFVADDGIHGRELWKSDGTAAGTALVKDVKPGAAGGTGVGITALKEKVLFFGDDSIHGSEPWVSDGTEAGTKLLKDIVPGTGSSYPVAFVVVDDKAFIIVNTDNYSLNEIWITDGTEEGTSLVYSLGSNPLPGTGIGFSFASFNHKLYFVNYSAEAGYEPWQSDGTTAGTVLLKDIEPGTASSNVTNFTVLNDKLYFSEQNPTYQYRTLWETDGTGNGTQPASGNNLNVAYNYNFYSPGYTLYKGALYLSGDAGYGNELYKYDPQTRAMTLVKDILPGTAGSSPYALAATSQHLYFAAYDANGYSQLWISDGTANSTTPIFTFDSIKNLNLSTQTFHDKLVFVTDDLQYGNEPWISDGTIAGTQLLKDINPGIYSSTYYNLSVFGNKLLFGASDGVQGTQLWTSDGTTAGTQPAATINTTSTAGSYPYLMDENHIVLNDKMIFTANNSNYGPEPWITDGTSAGTAVLKDIIPGASAGTLEPHYTSFAGKTYFYAVGNKDFTKLNVWTTDGSPAGTTLFQPMDTVQKGQYYPFDMAATSNRLFSFYNSNGNGAVVLSASDGVNPFQTLKKNIYRFDNYYPVALGNQLLFVSTDSSRYGTDELWKSDGTIAGTVRVKDINPGTSGSFPSNLILYNNKVYFRATDDGISYTLWASDGTEAGTQKVNGQLLSTVPFVISGGFVYFVDSDNRSLWRTDVSTGIATQISAFGSGSLSHLTDVNGTVCFQWTDGTFISLWKTFLTETSASFIKVLDAGSAVDELVNANGSLYFTVNGQLWQANETFTDAAPVADDNLADVLNIRQLTPANGLLYFDGFTQAYNDELYTGISRSVLPVQMLSFDARLQNQNVLVKWTTANENNLLHFEVQRSLHANDFTTIGTVSPYNTNTSVKNEYTFIDSSVFLLSQRTVYYRLRQTEMNGKVTLSEIRSVNLPKARLITLSPNPARENTFLYSSADLKNARVLMYDLNGRVLYETTQDIVKGKGYSIPVNRLAAGLYIVSITASDNTLYMEKLAVVK